MEARFLDLVRNNDVSQVSTALGEANASPEVSLDLGTLRDDFGRFVLELAADSGSREVAEVLLDHGAPVGDALLYAVDRQDVGAVRILKERALTESVRRTYSADPEIGSSAFPSYMTPVMLAALKNNYPILKMLLQAGFPTPVPDDYKWSTDISESIAWLDAYRAVCSPSYILLTSPDPFLTAFRTAKAVRDVLWKREHYRTELKELADQCEAFARELLSEARSTKETEAVLEHLCSPEDSPYRRSVSTLQLAVDLQLKQFATHPHCCDYINEKKFQELSDFHEYFQQWETASSVYPVLVSMAMGLGYPLLCLVHLLAPQSKIGKFSSLSVVRGMYWTFSWMVLLILLLVETQSYRMGQAEMDSIVSGTPLPIDVSLSPSAILIMIWAIDVGWKNLQEVRHEGLCDHFKQFWNILDFLMVALYIATVALRLVAYLKLDVYTDQETVADVWIRKARENSFQPIAVAEALFSIFTIVVFLRAVSLFMYQRFLGMLLISIGRMTVDITKFMAIGIVASCAGSGRVAPVGVLILRFVDGRMETSRG
ncbi:hypothetical protein Bbelb_181180 [Branchiostoma belcheri]|nr:hypothetical protein Bbelb_181180 [Branchiostoma belcheri]